MHAACYFVLVSVGFHFSMHMEGGRERRSMTDKVFTMKINKMEVCCALFRTGATPP